jgi:hypothetical protein
VLIGVAIDSRSTLRQRGEAVRSGQKGQFVATLESSTQVAGEAREEVALQRKPPDVAQDVLGNCSQERNNGLHSAAAMLGVVSLLAFRLKAPAYSGGRNAV